MAQILLTRRYHIILHGYNQNIRRDLAFRILPANQGHYHYYIVSILWNFWLVFQFKVFADEGSPTNSNVQPCHTGEAVKVMEYSLKTTLISLVQSLFGRCKYRWVEASFPFTYPSFELEIFYNGWHFDFWSKFQTRGHDMFIIFMNIYIIIYLV